ncbi:thymidylate synthase [Salmonella phage SH9]|uniref:thymidylate synthase n=1 Tax=Salmonella phage SH9 TaxID=2025819 RepID=A0A249Y0R6_9CAUD|nr:thymidylate synthase [Salmonella phage SH9]ASZ77835.1 thymidylate synthase [Salmonella phage SH9]
MKQYIETGKRILEEGVWVTNPRTGVRCLTIIDADFTFNVGVGELPLVSTRKAFAKQAIMEMIGYLRGYDSAAQFRAIGVNTWNANANENIAWLGNPFRKGEDDMGRVYGVQGRHWTNSDGMVFDQLAKVYHNLKRGIDDRGEILTFWNPGEFRKGCLRPCMHTHQFSILGDTLYLNSFQRSNDFLLGQVFNMVQCYALLAIMAQITGLKPGIARQKIINLHIYEDQYNVLMEHKQFDREPFASPTLEINPNIRTLDDVLTWVSKDDFTVRGYEHHPAIAYPFTV